MILNGIRKRKVLKDFKSLICVCDNTNVDFLNPIYFHPKFNSPKKTKMYKKTNKVLLLYGKPENLVLCVLHS